MHATGSDNAHVYHLCAPSVDISGCCDEHLSTVLNSGSGCSMKEVSFRIILNNIQTHWEYCTGIIKEMAPLTQLYLLRHWLPIRVTGSLHPTGSFECSSLSWLERRLRVCVVVWIVNWFEPREKNATILELITECDWQSADCLLYPFSPILYVKSIQLCQVSIYFVLIYFQSQINHKSLDGFMSSFGRLWFCLLHQIFWGHYLDLDASVVVNVYLMLSFITNLL